MQVLTLRRLVVDCRAIEENFRLIHRHLGERTRPIWIVKSNVYGLGLECIKAVSSEIAGYGVEDFAAAEEILGLDESKPVHIIYPISAAFCPPRLLSRVWEGAILPTVANIRQIDLGLHYAKEARVEGFEVQIKVRSFGGRFGVDPAELEETVAYARKNGLTVRGVFSHPSHSTGSTYEEIREECDRFVKMARAAAPEAPVHFADSACVLKGIGVDLDLVRVGMLPLGLLPMEPVEKWSSLQFAATLYARVISLHRLAQGEGVGYTHPSGKTPAQVGIAAIGYAHGIPRVIAEVGYGWWRGEKLAYAGPPWMEFSAFALSEDRMEILNEEVEILGPNASPHHFAWKAGKAPEEFIVRLSSSIAREVRK